MIVRCHKCGGDIDYIYSATSLDTARKMPRFWGKARKGLCHAFTAAGVEFIHFIADVEDEGLKSRMFVFDEVDF